MQKLNYVPYGYYYLFRGVILLRFMKNRLQLFILLWIIHSFYTVFFLLFTQSTINSMAVAG